MKVKETSRHSLNQLRAGKIYTWQYLKTHTTSPSRALKPLLDQGVLRKVGPGLYWSPKKSRFGELPPNEHLLIQAFLNSRDFLLINENYYNSLGLELTQLKNEIVVYNKKRYETLLLSDKKFHFKRPNNGYPKTLTPEFLVIDLLNNIKLIGETPSVLKQKVKNQISLGKFNIKKLQDMANQYGKIGTKKFLRDVEITAC
jgi:hypothetical protein